MKMKHFLIMFLLSLSVLVCGQEAVAADYYPYQINSYDVNIRVTKQNVYYVTETINVYFNQSRHGIYRDIPVVNVISREDGSSSRIQAKVEKIKCNAQSSVSRDGTYCRVRLGDPDRSITGEQTYTISYEYHMGNDALKNADEFYYNIIGTGWDTSISNVTFTVEMPEAIDERNMGMAYGVSGSTMTEGLRYLINGNVLQGELDSSITLSPGEAVTVRMVLPEGFFEKVHETIWPALLAILISLGGAGAAFAMWWKVGRDDPVVESIQFHPPKGLNSLEVAFAFNGRASNEDVVSLLVYLAQKGYIAIHEEAKKGLLAKNTSFSIQKTREYDGNNGAERLFMQGLFATGDIVEKKDLENTFYKTVNKILRLMNSKQNREVLFYANSINKQVICGAMAIVVFVMSVFKPFYDYSYSFNTALLMPAVFGLFYYIIIQVLFLIKGIASKLIFGIPFLFTLSAGFIQICYQAMKFSAWIYKLAFIIGMIGCFLIVFFDYFMPKRTEYGTEILGRLLGFRTFLKTAEKDRLETMVERNPQYFYEILPYTYVLGVSDKWMKKFETISMEPPHWYHSHYDTMGFSYMHFNSFMNSAMTTATSSMTSSPSSSGGGHSGGGSGGGGGGSW
ncbi:MAG: DUF2207 domain-containing protein [Lachnospiraceae bacterium]|nr:DUF2207 domain-containing protein [Lachnospiraceae bacterium]